MRYFVVDVEPTQDQLAAVRGAAMDGALVREEGGHVVTVPDDVEIPRWLSDGRVLNLPGEPHRCTNCGEPI